MKDAGNDVGVKNISDLFSKKIRGRLKTKNPTKKQIKECKMTEREIHENFENLGEGELNTKSNKNTYCRNDVITTTIKRSRGEKKRLKSNRWI